MFDYFYRHWKIFRGDVPSDFGGLVPAWDGEIIRAFMEGKEWTGPSWWIPRHLDIARLAYLYKQAAETLGLQREVVDLGCMNGFLSNLLAREGLVVHGIDISREDLEYADAYAVLCARSGKGSVDFTRKSLERVDAEKMRMVFCSWPHEGRMDDLLKKTIEEKRPDVLFLAFNEKDIVRGFVSTNPIKLGYEFGLRWKAYGPADPQSQHKTSIEYSSRCIIECYTLKGLKLRLPASVDRVEPYPWEVRFPDLDTSKKHHFYKISRKEPYHWVLRKDRG